MRAFNDNCLLEFGCLGTLEKTYWLSEEGTPPASCVAQFLTVDQLLNGTQLYSPTYLRGLELRGWGHFSTQIRSESSTVLLAFSSVLTFCFFSLVMIAWLFFFLLTRITYSPDCCFWRHWFTQSQMAIWHCFPLNTFAVLKLGGREQYLKALV